jgi:hypothetical protein
MVALPHKGSSHPELSGAAHSVWSMTTQQTETEWFRTPVPLRGNRVHWFAGRTHEVLDELGRPATWAMTARERGETVAELLALRSRIDAQLFAVVADADRADDAAAVGATSTAAWVRAVSGVTGAAATGLVRQSRAVEAHDQTHTALARGRSTPSRRCRSWPRSRRCPTSWSTGVPRLRSICSGVPRSTTRGRCGRWAGICWRWSRPRSPRSCSPRRWSGRRPRRTARRT